VIALALLAVPAPAEITSYSADITLLGDARANYKIELRLADTERLIFAIRGSPTNVKISAPCQIDRALLQTNIFCDMPPDKLTISYTSAERIARRGDYLLFTESLPIPLPARELHVLVRLPVLAAIKEPVQDAISPPATQIGSDGRHVLISWRAQDIEGAFDIQVAFEQAELLAALPALLAVIAAAAVAVFLYFRFQLRRERAELLMPALKPDEQAVYRGLLKHGDGVHQKVLVKESGWSKAKVSKVLKSLAERGLVRLEKIGRTNKVYFGLESKKKP
jgi:hypothetical protein